jgi:hypothetical protein
MEQIMDNPVKLMVVRHKKTGHMLPFEINERTGEVVIISSGIYNVDEFIVSMVPAVDCDWDTGYVVEEEN